jgi:hypothetical protein
MLYPPSLIGARGACQVADKSNSLARGTIGQEYLQAVAIDLIHVKNGETRCDGGKASKHRHCAGMTCGRMVAAGMAFGEPAKGI